MARRLRHHYVPQFYLRHFASKPRRIHVYNHSSSEFIRDVGLKNQCYRRRLYGGAEIEERLSDVENVVAPVLRRVVSQNALPAMDSEDHHSLLALVALQALRTARVAEITNQRIDKITKQVYSRDPRFADLDRLEFGYDSPALAALGFLPDVLKCITDLHVHLVVSPDRDVFLTSDNPTFRYNQSCETVRFQGTTGFIARGLQIFMPLSPRHQLVMYDGAVYRPRRRDRSLRTTSAARADIDAFNRIQLIAADENVYFSSWRQNEEIQRVLPTCSALRTDDPVVVLEYGQDDDPNSSLLHTYDKTPNLSLKLSVVKLKWRARMRKARPGYRYVVPSTWHPQYGGRIVRFSRFLGRR